MKTKGKNEIYVVTRGEYSDYSILGVYSTYENAKNICDRLNAGDSWYESDVEVYYLDDHVENLPVYMLDFDYQTLNYKRYTRTDDLEVGSRPVWLTWDKRTIRVLVYEKDLEDMIKVAAEKATQYKAEYGQL